MSQYGRLKDDILYERSQVELVLSDIERLDSEFGKDDATRDQKVAMAGYLMNFYNGIENIMKRSAKDYYQSMPKGELWHKQLLKLSGKPPKGKVALFTEDVVNKLYDYLAFRHFFVHGYGFKLSWDKIKTLVRDIDKLWVGIKSDIDSFINSLD